MEYEKVKFDWFRDGVVFFPDGKNIEYKRLLNGRIRYNIYYLKEQDKNIEVDQQ